MIDVNKLEGAELDLAVAIAEGKQHCFISGKFGVCWDSEATDDNDDFSAGAYTPSSNWAQGGPIIEREGINLGDPQTSPFSQWMAAVRMPAECVEGWGPTPLIAAMRAFVASRQKP